MLFIPCFVCLFLEIRSVHRALPSQTVRAAWLTSDVAGVVTVTTPPWESKYHKPSPPWGDIVTVYISFPVGFRKIKV